MAEINGFLLQQNHILQYTVLDSKSLLLSQFSNSNQPQLLQLTTNSLVMERGPRYEEYSLLREKRLRTRSLLDCKIPRKKEERVLNLTPPKKQVKFQGKSNLATPPKRSSSILTQSVPDFSSALRKENRKPPPSMLPPVAEKSLTPPAGSKSGRLLGVGSKSANSGEKRGGGVMATRKSHANMEDLKGFGKGTGRPLFGYRQF